MEIAQLVTLVHAAELGSVSRAADRLGIVQPALSRQIRLLEEELGAQLFAASSASEFRRQWPILTPQRDPAALEQRVVPASGTGQFLLQGRNAPAGPGSLAYAGRPSGAIRRCGSAWLSVGQRVTT